MTTTHATTNKPAREKVCWVISDGRAGIENQALGLANALAEEMPMRIETKRVRLRFPWNLFPSELFIALLAVRNPLPLFARRKDHMDPPWPDVLVATGRASLPYAIALKRLKKDQIFTIQTQNPRLHASLFDLVVPPRHDLLTGPNVEPILGAPNKVNDTYLRLGHQAIVTRIAHLPRPLVAVLIGGKSKHHKMPNSWTERLCDQLLDLVKNQQVGLMVTASRRTGETNRKILASKLNGANIFFWDGRGENPYAGFLASADYIIVTSDSTNMLAEAAATGKPVYVAHLPGGSSKFRRFLKDLAEYGAARPFTGKLQHWSYPPLRETQRIAKLAAQRINAAGIG